MSNNENKFYWNNQTERNVSKFRLDVQYTKKCYRVATFERLILIFIYIFWFTVPVKSLIQNSSLKQGGYVWAKIFLLLTPPPTHTYTKAPPIESY